MTELLILSLRLNLSVSMEDRLIVFLLRSCSALSISMSHEWHHILTVQYLGCRDNIPTIFVDDAISCYQVLLFHLICFWQREPTIIIGRDGFNFLLLDLSVLLCNYVASFLTRLGLGCHI